MKRVQLVAVVASIAGALLVGCLQTKNEVEVKPVDIGLNITGRLELVITDARRQEEAITGSAPKRTVAPEDIGFPGVAAPRAGRKRRSRDRRRSARCGLKTWACRKCRRRRPMTPDPARS